jgi:1-deoxy-D-xylulose-5-phosphate synthase
VEEAIAMTDYAIDQTEHPVAIRIPNGVTHRNAQFDKDYSTLNTFRVDKLGNKVALIGLGSYYTLAEEVAAELAKSDIDATIINPRFATGVDVSTLENLKANHQVTVTLENGVVDGGFGEKVARFYGASNMRVLVKGLKKEFYDKVPYGELMERNRLTPKQIAEDVLAALKSA